MQHSVWAAEIRMKLVADDIKIFGQIEQAFDYTDPAMHNGTINLKTIDFEGKKYIVSRRYILGDDRDYYLDFVAPSEGLRAEKTGEHGELKLYLNKRLVTRDNFNFQKGTQRQSFAGMANKRTVFQGISDYYNREKLEEDLETFTEDAYKRKVRGDVIIKKVQGDPFLEVVQFVDGLVVRGGGTIINALPKEGKSYTALLLAVSVDAGTSQIWSVKQGEVLFVNIERHEDLMIRRLAGVNTALGLDPARGLSMINMQGTPLKYIMDSIKYHIESEDIKLVIVDSISRAGMGSLTDDRVAVEMMDVLNGWVENTGRSWVSIAHRAWEGQHVFGSVQFFAACDVMVDLEKSHNETRNEMGVKVSVSGENDLPPSKPHVVAFGFDEFGLNSVRRATEEEFPDLMDERDNIRDRIWNHLRSNGKRTTTEIAQDLGEMSNSVYKTLGRMEKKNAVSRQGKHWELKNR